VPFDSTAFINPPSEGNPLPIEAAAATAVLGTVISLVDWEYRRTVEQVKIIYGVGLKIADFAADTARNIWDHLNSPSTPSDTQGRPNGAPPPGEGSLYAKARPGGNYYLRFSNSTGVFRQEAVGPSDRGYVIAIVDMPEMYFQGHSGPYQGGKALISYSINPNTGTLATGIHLVGEASGYPFNWQEGSYLGNPPTYNLVFSMDDINYQTITDTDPFIGPVPERKSPLKGSPIPSPLPKPKPSIPPFPKPQPEPDRKTQPLQPQPQPEPLPSPNPTPSPTKPEPATTPTEKPSPFIPNIVPQVLPPKTTPTNPDGSRQTAPIVGPITTPVGSEKIGPITIPKNSPQPTLEGIAGEVGRIEQKLASMIRPSAGDDLTDRIGLLGSILKAIYEQFFTGLPAGEYILSSPCEKDEQGDRVEYQVPILQTVNKYDAIFERLDALANLIQTHKDLKQPICRGSQPTGQPVTVNFTQIE